MSSEQTKQIITRFAPSPTGYLHIGGARTALFNYLYAKRNNGKFLLRIEDTDKARSTKEAVDAILHGLNWLGLAYDGEPIMQSEQIERHKEIALELLENGHAFKCYMTEEETNEARELSLKEGRAIRSIYRDSKQDLDLPFTIRLRAPDIGEVIIQDKVQGDVKTAASNIDDMVLLRTDGTPTYMLAVVVDDYDMGVTHIIRGDDHLTNAARQSVIISAMNWPKPIYAHIPLIHGDDGKKLSKRHGALAVGEYENFGYLPEAILSYLLRLGWSKGDLDIVPISEAINIFDLEGLGKSPSRLDFAKLDQVNAHFIKNCDNSKLFGLLKNEFSLKNIVIVEETLTKIEKSIEFVKERAKTILELKNQTEFIWTNTPLVYNEKAKATVNSSKDYIISAIPKFTALNVWDSENIKQILLEIAEEKNVGMGKIGPVIRAALTGGLIAPDLAITIYILEKTETLKRLEFSLN